MDCHCFTTAPMVDAVTIWLRGAPHRRPCLRWLSTDLPTKNRNLLHRSTIHLLIDLPPCPDLRPMRVQDPSRSSTKRLVLSRGRSISKATIYVASRYCRCRDKTTSSEALMYSKFVVRNGKPIHLMLIYSNSIQSLHSQILALALN